MVATARRSKAESQSPSKSANLLAASDIGSAEDRFAEDIAPAVDVTVVLNAHREGLLIHRSLRSVLRAVEFAAEQHINCEVLVILDRPDGETSGYFARADLVSMRVMEVDYGDPALSRNFGASVATGTYTAYVDGDDLISRNWLANAFIFAEEQRNAGRRLVLHPELSIFFGAECSILEHVDQESPEWRASSLLATNYWTALAFARTLDFCTVPYRASAPETGFGFEDWDWNCLSVGAGLVHKVIPNTWHFIRLKERGSRNTEAKALDLLIRPSPMFDWLEHDSDVFSSDTERADDDGDPGSARGTERVLSSPGMLAEWRNLAMLEPELFPSLERLDRYYFWKPSSAHIGMIFGRLMHVWAVGLEAVILCRQLSGDSAGVAALNYARALADSGLDVLIVAEKGGAVQRADQWSGSIRVLDLDTLSEGLDEYWRARLLGYALVHRPPRTVHVVDSVLACQTVSAYGRAISSRSRIFLTVSPWETSAEGERTGHPVTHFDQLAPHVTGLLGESHAVLEWFCDTFGFPRQRCHRVRATLLSIAGIKKANARSSPVRPSALWSGSDGRLSCPSMLVKIAQSMPDWDFLIYGEGSVADPWPVEVDEALRAEPNIVWVAGSERFSDALGRATVMLQTSLIDGVSTRFFEALVEGVPIVAPGLMAIQELIDEDTGYPVADFSSPDAYVARLYEMQREPRKARQRVLNARRRVESDFSWSTFVEALKAACADA